ncbi:hypothetical protein ILUMI_23032 [Ignelater luminosus]|uniref:Sm domain-containing protein n=1 Tax=Ignelater luminosus TaxID=2038154 RepID=A0A8K0G2A7_IGNLU|nr:hypothetical protein ILUMI_23032 [Ignelater luminosus]
MAADFPLYLLENIINMQITCVTKDNVMYTGILLDMYRNLDCRLGNIQVTYLDNRTEAKKFVFLRGSTIMYFSILSESKQLADELKAKWNEEQLASKDKSKSKGKKKSHTSKAHQGKEIQPKKLPSFSKTPVSPDSSRGYANQISGDHHQQQPKQALTLNQTQSDGYGSEYRHPNLPSGNQLVAIPPQSLPTSGNPSRDSGPPHSQQSTVHYQQQPHYYYEGDSFVPYPAYTHQVPPNQQANPRMLVGNVQNIPTQQVQNISMQAPVAHTRHYPIQEQQPPVPVNRNQDPGQSVQYQQQEQPQYAVHNVFNPFPFQPFYQAPYPEYRPPFVIPFLPPYQGQQPNVLNVFFICTSSSSATTTES